MNEIGAPNNLPPVVPPEAERVPAERTARPASPNSAAVRGDRVELSEAAAAYDAQTAAVNDARMREIRTQIAEDTYLTPNKLDVAIEGLLRDMLSEPPSNADLG